MSVTPELEVVQFPEHYAYVLVDSNEKKEIFYLPMTGGFKGFIDRFAFDWFEGSNPPSTRSVIEVIIDGVTRKFEYEVQINMPYIFDPPIVVINFIRVVVTNNDVPYVKDGEQKSGAHYYGFMVDGCLARPKT
jgi:hypothetical protein